MQDLQIVELPLGQIVPYENNPRRNDHAVDIVAKSIAAYGFRVPILFNPQHVILPGHTRHKAAFQLGLDKAPCIVLQGLTDAQERALRLVDNKSSEPAEWDISKLKEELATIRLDIPDTIIDGLFSLSTDELSNVDDLYNSPSAAKAEPEKRVCTCPKCRKEFEL